MEQYLDFAKELAYEAGEIMMRYFEAENLGLELKSDMSPVTLADKEVNRLVIDKVKSRFPDHGVFGEEESYNQDLKKLWIVDPIDGTYDFAIGLGGWVFSMAFVEDGQPKVAVIYSPIFRRLFWAAEGLGAYENDRKLQLLDEVPAGFIHVSSWVGGGQNGVLFKDITIEGKVLEAYNKISPSLVFVHNDPVAHGLALAASNRYQAAVSSCINPWDLAAGGFIAEQAGAIVTDIFGKPIQRWDENFRGILAAPPKLHQLLLETIMPVIKEAEMQ